ncbi:eIF-2-alpha kinase GCN2 isoform X2 [Nymphaea colorata]|uniref:eIF-2-alpha kinase GCN2 isoform X2 n=1 Tax=Nymphaea colorata TaxID=210225 RepID=UPI00129D7A85|nr:eIF-2-alpha kinase GCN2 isoform X2 [Nymphaea colorata]
MGRNSKRKKKRGSGASDGRRNKGRDREQLDEDDDSVAKQSAPQLSAVWEDSEIGSETSQVHGSKKKKRGGVSGGRKGKGRSSSRDHSHEGGDGEVLTEELTAMHAIFQDDFKLVSETPYTQCIVSLRPHSAEFDSFNPNMLANLIIRCLPGYPYKCPKLQVIPEKGLSKDDTEHLLSILLDQANVNAREGRVMIFNLVEAAQEFLTGLVSDKQSHEVVSLYEGDKKGEKQHADGTFSSEKTDSTGEFYCMFDLFSDLYGESQSWDGDTALYNVHEKNAPFSQCRTLAAGTSREAQNDKHVHSSNNPDISHMLVEKNFLQNSFCSKPQVVNNLEPVDEASEDENKSMSARSLDTPLASESTGGESYWSDVDDTLKKLFLDERKLNQNSDSDHELLDSLDSELHDQTSEAVKDLVMVHLLRLVCSSNQSSYSLPEIASELSSLGILPEWAKDLATKKPMLFDKAFHRVFHHYMDSERSHDAPATSFFWSSVPVPDGKGPTSTPASRYLSDFEEIRSLGRGAFGHVVLCRNKLDGRQYAVKRIPVKDKRPSVNDKILREVATLSRLQHQHVVRYYQAWFETSVGVSSEEISTGSLTFEKSTCSHRRTGSSDAVESENMLSTYLYIQMEYCPKTLRQYFEESYKEHFDKESAWHFFRQIVEGLAHIHGQGIIHRDLNPNNIFFGAVGDIKIGDFGLAKFLKFEQSEYDPSFGNEVSGVSFDGTGKVGTYLYTAPEIEQGWPHIDEKVDMYSLGIVFFELWHPFATVMERSVILSDLKQKWKLPPVWASEFPEQAVLLQRLVASSPSDRPSALEVLQDALPPRMEDEWLKDILRTIQASEDSYVYDRVISAIFDEESYLMKAQSHLGGRKSTITDDSSFSEMVEADLHDRVSGVAKDVCKQHGAKRFEIPQLRVLDDCPLQNRNAVKLLTSGGDMLELCHELRLPFVEWVVAKQKVSLKRYEISWVYRRAVGHSAPNRYLQGDFDIIGGAPSLTEAETIKVAMDIMTRFFHHDTCDIRLNHGCLLDAIWSWIGIKGESRQNVAKLLSWAVSSCPQSINRRSKWVLIRRQLMKDPQLSEAIINKLQTVDRRFCGSADEALARLRDKSTRDALGELSLLLSYLRWWNLEKHISIDVLMPPSEIYYRGLFFQIYVTRGQSHGYSSESTLVAVGGRYDNLLHRMWDKEHRSSPPGAVGLSLALEKIVHLTSSDRTETNISVLVCSKGGGGFLEERMKLVAELWEANIKAELVPVRDPSLTEQYEYANDHEIKCLIILTESGLSQNDSVKVRNLEHKTEMDISRGNLIKFLTEANSTQFRRIPLSKMRN